MVMLGQFWGILRNFEIFHDRLGPERWNWGNHIMAWNLMPLCSLPWSGSLYEMPILSLCLHFLISAYRCCRSLNVLLYFLWQGLSHFLVKRVFMGYSPLDFDVCSSLWWMTLEFIEYALACCWDFYVIIWW